MKLVAFQLTFSQLIIKITISSIVIGFKKLLFPTNPLVVIEQSFIGQLVIAQYVIGQVNKPITFKVVL